MIGPVCSMCDTELEEPGALLLGPPNNDPDVSLFKAAKVEKAHLCVRCYTILVAVIEAVTLSNVETWAGELGVPILTGSQQPVETDNPHESHQ